MHTYDLSGGKLCDTLPAALRADILSGTLAPGTKLPSKRRLAEHHGISVNTVQNAYEQLIAEGYIEARERSGYFVIFRADDGFVTTPATGSLPAAPSGAPAAATAFPPLSV